MNLLSTLSHSGRLWRHLSKSFLLGGLLTSCASGEHSFLIIQTCLRDNRGVALFMSEMQTVARTEKMEYIDNSENTARQLQASGYESKERTHGSHVINIGVQRSDGMGVTAGNLGLPGFEIALGFSQASDPVAANAFARRVEARLAARWDLVIVPSGSTAKPLGGCP